MRSASVVLSLWIPLTLGCETAGAPAPSGSGDGDVPGAALPAAICAPAPGFAAGDAAFVDRSVERGLGSVYGVRITAVDFDGDGWTDLHVARGNEAADDFAEGGVRSSWLLRNVGGTFEDVTEASGFRALRGGGQGRQGQTLAWGDVDNDGDIDAYTGVNDPADAIEATSEVVLNRGDGTFELAPTSAVRSVSGDVPAGAAFVDVDRDGLLDLWVGQNSINYSPQQDRLWRGQGDGTFRDVTVGSGLGTRPWDTFLELNLAAAHSNAWSAAACDVNGDHRPDLLAASYGRAPNHLWVQQEDGGYLNRSIASGYAFDPRMDWSDNQSARCWCQIHPDDEGCAGVPAPDLILCETEDDAFRWSHDTDRMQYRLGGNSGTTVCADVDNDQDFDLLTTEIVHWDVGSSSDPSELLFNDGEGVFSRPGNAVTGLVREHTMVAWNDGDITGAVFDFDNDRWPDVWVGSTDYEGARGLLWRQVEAGRFEAVPISSGLDHPRAHGVAIADFDRDGDLDLVVGHSTGRCAADCVADPHVRLWENQTAGAFVQLTLEGAAGSNRAAIGARVELTAGGVTQTRLVDGGHGHYGLQHDLTQHFGLGDACEASVRVVWPDAAATEQTFELTAGHRFKVVQGEAPAVAR